MDDTDAELDNLYSGSASNMFANERLESKTKKIAEGEQERQKSELIPIAQDLLNLTTIIRAENANYRDYARNIFAKNGKQKASAVDIEVEFRARELNLLTLDRIDRWIKTRLRHQQQP